jgi:hypothetical protein
LPPGCRHDASSDRAEEEGHVPAPPDYTQSSPEPDDCNRKCQRARTCRLWNNSRSQPYDDDDLTADYDHDHDAAPHDYDDGGAPHDHDAAPHDHDH